MKHLLIPIKILAIIWIVFILDVIIPIDFNKFGLLPRSESGIIGIFTAPFLHANLSHIVSNSIPLLALLTITAIFHGNKIYKIILLTVVIGGAFEWVFARSAYHVGASGLIYGLVGYLIFYCIFERKIIPLLLSLGVGLYYGTTMWIGMLPSACGNISWEGHLFGAVAGVVAAKLLTNK